MTSFLNGPLNDNQPTYTNDVTGNQDVKDLIFCSPEMFKTFKDFWVDEDLGSDHNIILATFSHQNIHYKIPPKQIKLYHKANWQKINSEVTNNMKNHQINNESTCEQCDKSIAHLTETITTLTIKPERIGLDKTIIELIKDKRKNRKLYQRTGIIHYKTKYNQLNKQIKQIIKTENKHKWVTQCNDLDFDTNQQNT